MYAPLDEGVPVSTVSICGGPLVLAVWACVLASKDQDGVTRLTPRAIEALWSQSREPRPLADIQDAWDYLCSPDPASANRDYEGRRLIPTEDGRWTVVSHEKYRDRHSGASYRASAAQRQQRRREKLKRLGVGSDGGAGHESAASAARQAETSVVPAGDSQTAPPSEPASVGSESAGGVEGHASDPRANGNPSALSLPTYTPSIEYPTRESRREAELEAHEHAGHLEGQVARSSMQVFAEASDYPGAGRMVTRAESCSAPRLERTLVTLRGWRQAVDLMLRPVDPEKAWKARPRVGEGRPAVAPRNSQTAAWDEAEARLKAEIARGGQNAGRGVDAARVGAGAPGGAVVPRQS